MIEDPTGQVCKTEKMIYYITFECKPQKYIQAVHKYTSCTQVIQV